MLERVLRQLRWSRLRTLGNSGAVRMSIFIPVIGYMVLFNENLLHYIDLSKSIFGNQSENMGNIAHVSWRLIFIYFGLCFLAIGSILYQSFCPLTIKRFANNTEFIASTLRNMGNMIPEGIEALLREQMGSRDHLQNLQNTLETRRIRANEVEKQHVLGLYQRDLLSLFFSFLDQQRPIVRAVTAAAYAIGFTILSIPTLDVFSRVIMIAYSRI